jgi:4'-phosphopantetheinyl transferase
MTDIYWLEQGDADIPAEDNWLSSSEVTRLKTMRFVKRRNDWRLGRWTAKRALAIYFDRPTDPQVLASIELRPAQSGAPEAFFANHPMQVAVSLSHRAGTAICALASPGTALGCDLELIETRADSFLMDYFTSAEQALVVKLPAVEQPRLVTLLWSAKESALKALRVGLQQDTRNVTVTFGDVRDAVCGWQPLQVRHFNGQIFRGWWQQNAFVKTVVSSLPPLPPTAL